MFLRADIDFSSSNGPLQYTLRKYNACFNFERGKKMNKQNPFDHLQGLETLKIHGDI